MLVGAVQAVDALRRGARDQLGWRYTIYDETVSSRVFGNTAIHQPRVIPRVVSFVADSFLVFRRFLV